MEHIIFKKFLLNLAGCHGVAIFFLIEILLSAREPIFLNSIVICNASGNIQVFSEMFVSCYVHSFSPLNCRVLNVQFQVLVDIYFVQRSVFTRESLYGRVETFSSHDTVDQGSNPVDFTPLV